MKLTSQIYNSHLFVLCPNDRIDGSVSPSGFYKNDVTNQYRQWTGSLLIPIVNCG